jgi:hypothetical protein
MSGGTQGKQAMFKLAAIAALVALLSACSSMSGGSTTTSSSGMSRTTMGAPGAGMGNGIFDSYGSGASGPN